MNFKNIILTLLLLLLVTVGIGLFFAREHLTPNYLGHEVKIGPQKISPQISVDQFLVLIHKPHLDKLAEILSPLKLEVKMPLLNWLLVGPIAQNEHKTAILGSDNAVIAQQTLASLLNHPYVLDAHHNYIMEPTTIENNSSLINQWQLMRQNDKHPFSLNLQDALTVNSGSKNVAIAVVDDFSQKARFNFKEIFKQCQHRVSFFQAIKYRQQNSPEKSSPHGEPLLLALGACNGIAPFSQGIDSHAHIIAAEPPFMGHAEVFLTALAASSIDVCKESIVACPPDVQMRVNQHPIDVLLLPIGNKAPDLLQISSDMIAAINKKGVVVVTSAGNEKTNANSFFPGGAPGVINVGATGKKGRASFSNWGPTVDLLAPGEDIEFVYPNGMRNISGTSIAAAYTAGAISLLKTVRPELSLEETKHILSRSGSNIACEDYCLANNNTEDLCNGLCCDHTTANCSLRALDIAAALRYAAQSSVKTPLLKVSPSYVLYLRDEEQPKIVTVSNVGHADAVVKVTGFDERVDFGPKEFVLKAKNNNQPASQDIKLFFKREPFTRQTFSFVVTAYLENLVVDRAEFFLEYIPKK